MEDKLTNPTIRMRTDELLAFQRDLKEEKEALNKLLTKIDAQVHALQVEQLHLLSLMNKSLQPEKTKKKKAEKNQNTLDLSVAPTLQYFEEEIEEDEDEDNT